MSRWPSTTLAKQKKQNNANRAYHLARVRPPRVKTTNSLCDHPVNSHRHFATFRSFSSHERNADDPYRATVASPNSLCESIYLPVDVAASAANAYTYSRCTFSQGEIAYSAGQHYLHPCMNVWLPFRVWTRRYRTLEVIRRLCDTNPEFRSQSFPNGQSWSRENPQVQ